MINITNKAWSRDNEGLYFTIELGPHTNNSYSVYPRGGFFGDVDFKLVDIGLNFKDQLQANEQIVAVDKISFELDDQILAAGGSIAGNTLVRTGFINSGENHYAIIQFIENLDETMEGIYAIKYKVTTDQGRVYANKFRIKIIKTIANFHSERDNFVTARGQLHGII